MLAGPSGPSESQRQAAVKAVTPTYSPRGMYSPPSYQSQNRAFGPSPQSAGKAQATEAYRQRRGFQRQTMHVGRIPSGRGMVSSEGRREAPLYVRGSRVGLSGGVEYSKGSLTPESKRTERNLKGERGVYHFKRGETAV